MYVHVTMLTLSQQSLPVLESHQNQQEAVGSIFQPIYRKNCHTVQADQWITTPVTGIFMRPVRDNCAWSSHEIWWYRHPCLPHSVRGTDLSCFDLYPNATNVKPDFWVD